MATEERLESKPPRRGARRREPSADVAARRHQGRMLALQVLYEVDLTDHDPEEAMARAFAEHEPVTPDVVEHVRSLVRGVGEHRDALDPIIAGAAPARALAEQAAIERNVLRLAAYELLNVPSVPPKVAINEGSSSPSASVARTPEGSSTACYARFSKSIPARMGR